MLDGRYPLYHSNPSSYCHVFHDGQIEGHEAGQGEDAADVLPEQNTRHLRLLVLVNGDNSLQQKHTSR